MLCDQTNYRYCRLTGRIENHGCAALQLGTGVVVYDIPLLILAIIVALFFLGFVQFLKAQKLEWKKQIPTRGVWLWRAHLFLCGLNVFFTALSVSLVATDGRPQQSMLACRGAAYFAAFVLLYWITLVDIHLVPSFLILDIVAICVSTGLGCVFLTQLDNPTAMGMITMTILLPIGASFFNLFAMVPVCFKRKLWMGILYSFLMCGFHVCAIFVELYANAVLCDGTSGIFTGTALSILVFAFYRVFVQMFFVSLKLAEKEDDLPLKKRRDGDPDSDDPTKPFPVEFKDYSYDYTYSDPQENNG
jgi:hypothetical protein